MQLISSWNATDSKITNKVSICIAYSGGVDFLENILIDTSGVPYIILLSFERESISGCFEYPQYYHQTHEKNFRAIWKKSLQIFGFKISIIFLTILYSFRRVLDDFFDFKCLWKTLHASASHVLYMKKLLQDQSYLENVEWIVFDVLNTS